MGLCAYGNMRAVGEDKTGNEILQPIRSVIMAALHQTAEPVAVKKERDWEYMQSGLQIT
jgi:hypothetical protein